MATKLERLLESIDPARTVDDVAARIDGAINSFPHEGGRTETWDEFKTVLTRFFCHIEAKVFRLGSLPDADPEFHWGRCCQILVAAFGPNGRNAAFDMAKTGVGGGLYAVLRAVALQMAEEYAENAIRARVHDYWNGLSVEEQLAASKEYLAKYGHLLPAEMTEGNAPYLRMYLPEWLKQHPQWIRRLRQVGR